MAECRDGIDEPALSHSSRQPMRETCVGMRSADGIPEEGDSIAD